MKISKKYSNDLKIFFLILIFLSYFIGFFLRENIAGGAENDFLDFTWPAILAFKDSFYSTLLNYGKFGEGSLPLFHIINAYLNPFTQNQYLFQTSITLLSLLNLVFFYKIIKKKYNLKKLDGLLFSSIFLILPFFRSSAFWGLTENLGWLFLLISIKHSIDYEEEKKRKNVFKILLVCIFSSLALYTRPYLIFFPLFLIVNNFVKKDFYFLKNACIFYFFLSLPGLLLLYIWGGYFKVGTEQTISLIDFHNPKFIFKNLIIFSSIFLFYFLPLEIIKIFKKYEVNRIVSIKYFLIIFIFLNIINYYNIVDYLKIIELGGGAFLKINKFFFNKNLFFFLLLSSLGAALIINYFIISIKNKILIFSLLIFCFPKYILQEYFEPLILIVMFCLLDSHNNLKKIIREDKTVFIFVGYFILYLFSSYIYRYKI